MQGEFGFGGQGGLPGSSGDAYLPGTFSSCLCVGFLGSLGRKLEGVYITILETFGVEVEQEEPFELTMLSSRQLRQLRWAFNVLDEDGSGTLEGAELEGLIQLLGDNPTQAEAKELLAWIDQDGDGVISFEEFARAWWMVRAPPAAAPPTPPYPSSSAAAAPAAALRSLPPSRQLPICPFAFPIWPRTPAPLCTPLCTLMPAACGGSDRPLLSRRRRATTSWSSPFGSSTPTKCASPYWRVPRRPWRPRTGLAFFSSLFSSQSLGPWQDGRVSAEELTEVFTKMGERLSDEEMDEFLGWLGLGDGGSINLVNFKKLPCWQPEEVATAGAPKKGGMLSHFSQVPRPPRPPRPLRCCNTLAPPHTCTVCKPLRKPVRKSPANPCANPCAIF